MRGAAPSAIDVRTGSLLLAERSLRDRRTCGNGARRAAIRQIGACQRTYACITWPDGGALAVVLGR